MLAGQIETCALIYLRVCECGCVSVCVSNDCLQGRSAGPLSLFSVHPRSQRRPLPGRPALPLGTPAGGGQSLVQCRHFGVPGAGWGATQLSSSLQCQEEDGQGSPELWVGLAGGSTARHYHHYDRGEKGDRPGFWSTRQGQRVAGRQLVCGKARYPAPSLCGV